MGSLEDCERIRSHLAMLETLQRNGFKAGIVTRLDEPIQTRFNYIGQILQIEASGGKSRVAIQVEHALASITTQAILDHESLFLAMRDAYAAVEPSPDASATLSADMNLLAALDEFAPPVTNEIIMNELVGKQKWLLLSDVEFIIGHGPGPDISP